MKLEFTWKKINDRYSTGEACYLNRIHVAGYCWNYSSQKDPGQKWRGQVHLPSLKNEGWAYGATEEEVKAAIEAVVKQWFCEAVSE